ncbi:unnamed protein product [Paramecium sonneborni]|uniref:Uncharacterized protein n=1 Tax=Paramecium sonneborni TaxID=65129 RepID=A0A8S1QZG1_9CILI|nr:unnamed protein product [Paramecium sonneborni]
MDFIQLIQMNVFGQVYWKILLKLLCASLLQHMNKKLVRKSFFKEIDHNQQKVSLKIWSTTNQNIADEAYLFRSVQVILDRCYKTCKTCSGQ